MLDCGASRVALARFARTKSGTLRLETFAWEPLDSGAENGGWLDATAAALARVAQRAHVAAPVTLVLPGHLVLTKLVKTPRVDAAKRAKVVRFEAQQNIPYALDDVVWGHAVAGESAHDLDVMLCAAKREAVEALCAAAERSGFRPRVVLPSVCAFRAAVAASASAEPTLFANLGARSTTFLLVEPPRVHARTVALGSPTKTNTTAEPTAMATEAFAARLAQEITRSAVHFKRATGAAAPARVVLSGGASRGSPDLATLLAARVHVPVERFEPLAGVEVSPSGTAADAGQFAAHLVDLVGAARVQFESDASAISLLPPRCSAWENRRRRQPWLVAAAVLAATAFVPVLDYHRAREAVLRHQVAALDAEIGPLREREARNRANLEKLAALRHQLATLHAIAARRTAWPELLADLQERLAKIEDVWLDRVQLVANGTDLEAPLRLEVSGRMLDRTNPLASVSADASRRAARLLASVADSPYVAAVERERFDRSQPGVLRFDVVLVTDPALPL